MATVEIPLAHRKYPGKVALIDAEDYPRVVGYRWRYMRKRTGEYAVATVRESGKERIVALHRVITNAPNGVDIDHENLNGLDCRKRNLRYATASQNAANRKVPISSRSGFKGVQCTGEPDRWIAHIGHNGTHYRFGTFPTKEDAARVYDAAAVHFFGEYARTNFVELSPEAVAWVDHCIAMRQKGLCVINTSGYHGVSWYKKLGKWTSGVHFGGRRYHVGYFDDPVEAAIAYDRKAVELIGDRARLNFPPLPVAESDVQVVGEGKA